MRDWEVFVREHLQLADLTPEREARIVREIATQLEDFYRDALACGASDAAADTHARAQIPDWTRMAADVRRADTPHVRPRVDAGPASSTSKAVIIEAPEKLTMTQPASPMPCEPGERPSMKVAAANPISRAPRRRGQNPVSVRGSPRTRVVVRGPSASISRADFCRGSEGMTHGQETGKEDDCQPRAEGVPLADR